MTTSSTEEKAAPVFRSFDWPSSVLIPCATSAPGAVSFKQAGERVWRGDALAEPHPSFRHLPVASIDGVVAGLKSVAIGLDCDVPAMDVELSRDRGAPAPPAAPTGDAGRQLREGSLAEWIDRFRNGGIWADRWSSPDIIAQLDRCLTRPVDTIICSLLDLDPAIPLQLMIACRWGEQMIVGVKALAKLTGAGRSWLAIPDNLDWQVLQRLNALIAGTDVRLVPVSNRYPLAHPSLLLQALTGRLLRFGTLPVEQGAIILDAAASTAVGEFVSTGLPMTDVPIAIFNQPAAKTHFLVAPIGVSFQQMMESVGLSSSESLLSAGTPLHEKLLSAGSVAGGGELTIYASRLPAGQRVEPCIRCAWCIEACPVRIQPAALLEAAQKGDKGTAEEFGLAACVECGICSVVCPSRLPLLQGIRTLRRS